MGAPAYKAGRPQPTSIWFFLPSVVRRWYDVSALRLLLTELCNLLYRIVAVLRIRTLWNRDLPGRVPPEMGGFSVGGCHSCRRTYTLDIRRLEADFPFLSFLDIHLATRMYLAGLRKAPCNCRSGIARTQEENSSYVPRDGDKSTPAKKAQSQLGLKANLFWWASLPNPL